MRDFEAMLRFNLYDTRYFQFPFISKMLQKDYSQLAPDQFYEELSEMCMTHSYSADTFVFRCAIAIICAKSPFVPLSDNSTIDILCRNDVPIPTRSLRILSNLILQFPKLSYLNINSIQFDYLSETFNAFFEDPAYADLHEFWKTLPDVDADQSGEVNGNGTLNLENKIKEDVREFVKGILSEIQTHDLLESVKKDVKDKMLEPNFVKNVLKEVMTEQLGAGGLMPIQKIKEELVAEIGAKDVKIEKAQSCPNVEEK